MNSVDSKRLGMRLEHNISESIYLFSFNWLVWETRCDKRPYYVTSSLAPNSSKRSRIVKTTRSDEHVPLPRPRTASCVSINSRENTAKGNECLVWIVPLFFRLYIITWKLGTSAPHDERPLDTCTRVLALTIITAASPATIPKVIVFEKRSFHKNTFACRIHVYKFLLNFRKSTRKREHHKHVTQTILWLRIFKMFKTCFEYT